MSWIGLPFSDIIVKNKDDEYNLHKIILNQIEYFRYILKYEEQNFIITDFNRLVWEDFIDTLYKCSYNENIENCLDDKTSTEDLEKTIEMINFYDYLAMNSIRDNLLERISDNYLSFYKMYRSRDNNASKNTDINILLKNTELIIVSLDNEQLRRKIINLIRLNKNIIDELANYPILTFELYINTVDISHEYTYKKILQENIKEIYDLVELYMSDKNKFLKLFSLIPQNKLNYTIVKHVLDLFRIKFLKIEKNKLIYILDNYTDLCFVPLLSELSYDEILFKKYLELLLNNNKDINETVQKGQDILSLICGYKAYPYADPIVTINSYNTRRRILEFLLSLGMNPNKLYYKNYTCLHYLVLSYFPPQTLRVFMDYGADPSITNYKNKNPLDLVLSILKLRISYTYEQIPSLLLEYQELLFSDFLLKITTYQDDLKILKQEYKKEKYRLEESLKNSHGDKKQLYSDIKQNRLLYYERESELKSRLNVL